MKLANVRYRPWIVYTAFSLLSLGVMTSNLQGGRIADLVESTALGLLAPIYMAVDRVVDRIHSLWTGYVNLVDVQAENQHLKEIILSLREEHLLLQDKANEADRLESIISASFRSRQATIRANVIRRGTTLLNPAILIDRGSSDGIRTGLGVATADGALGQIVYVTSGMSKLITLHHTDSGIGAMVQRNRIQGVVSGTGKNTAVMRFISRFDPVTLGEIVVTSGLDGAFPKGVPIGRVAGIRHDAGEIFQTLEIITNANINAVEEVIVFLMPRIPDGDFEENNRPDIGNSTLSDIQEFPGMETRH